MKIKTILKITLLLLILAISFFVYFKYLKINHLENKIDITKKKEDIITKNVTDFEKKNLINDIKYSNKDINGNVYSIEAKEGEIKKKNSNEISLTDVYAVVNFKNKSAIYIFSKFADYNSNSFDTNFHSNVVVKYENNILESKNLDIFFKDNYGIMYNNIKFINDDSKIIADKLFFDLVNGDIKINMYNKDDKIVILKN